MKWGISSLEELEMMKEKMDRVWHELFEETDGKEDEMERRFEKLPKSEGTRKPLRPRSGNPPWLIS